MQCAKKNIKALLALYKENNVCYTKIGGFFEIFSPAVLTSGKSGCFPSHFAAKRRRMSIR